MKKILSMLSALIIGASSASTVLACSTTQAVPNIDNEKSQSLRSEAVDKLKSYAIADQYGTDLGKTVSADTYSKTPDFSDPSVNSFNGLNMDGTLGKDNLPLYQWNKTLNEFLGKFGVNPIDLMPYLDQWGGAIKEIPSLIKSGNINALLQLLPTTLLNAASYITAVPTDPGSIDWFAIWLKQNIKYVMSEFDFSLRIKDMVDQAKEEGVKATMPYIVKQGLDSLQELGDFLFFQYMAEPGTGYQKGDDLDDTSKDSSISLFLGQEVFTKLFNGQSIDSSSIKKKMGSPAAVAWYVGNMKQMIDDLATFLASIMMQLSLYIPMTMNLSTGVYKADDQDHLFFSKDESGKLTRLGSNDEAFQKYDSTEVTYDDDGNIMFGDEKHNISLDNSIYGVIDLVSNTDPDSFAIERLTNILFHDSGENSLIDRLTYLLLDALKFTDYAVVVPEKDVAAGIKVDINFKLKQLFEARTIKLATIPDTIAKAVGVTDGSLIGVANMIVDIHTDGNGLLNKKADIAQVLHSLLINKKANDDEIQTDLKNILGTDKDGKFVLNYEYDYGWGSGKHWVAALVNNSTIWSIVWTGKAAGLITVWKGVQNVVPPLVDELLGTLYYTDGSKLFDALKGTGFVSDDQLDDMKNGFGKKLPLSKTILYAMQNTALGDLTQYSGLVRLDSIADILKILFYENPIQDPAKPVEKGKKPSPDEGHRSLFSQILISLNGKYDETRGAEWNYYLGYLTSKEVADQADWKQDDHYVLREGFIGKLVEALYPDLDNANDITTTPTIVEMPKDKYVAPKQPTDDSKKNEKSKVLAGDGTNTLKVISLENLEYLDSEVMDKLDNATAKLSHDLQGDDVNDIVDAILKNSNQDKLWTTSNVVNRWFNGNNDLRYESFDLTFDTESLGDIKHVNKDNEVVMLKPHKVTYRIIYSRSDSSSKFEFKSIKKIS